MGYPTAEEATEMATAIGRIIKDLSKIVSSMEPHMPRGQILARMEFRILEAYRRQAEDLSAAADLLQDTDPTGGLRF